LALADETVFWLFKEQVPLKLKKKYQWFNAKGIPFDLYQVQPLLVFTGQSL
jgi:hypothetical protein